MITVTRDVNAHLGVAPSVGHLQLLSDTTSTEVVGDIFDRFSHTRKYESAVAFLVLDSTNLSNTKTISASLTVTHATSTSATFDTLSTSAALVLGTTTTSTSNPTPKGVLKAGVSLWGARRYVRIVPTIAFGATSSVDSVRLMGGFVLSVADQLAAS